MDVEMIGPKVPVGAPKVNNLVETNRHVLPRLKYLLWLQLVVGVNRLYLITEDKSKMLLGSLYTVVVTTLTIFVMASSDMTSATYLVFRNTLMVEFALLSINSMLLYKKTLKKFFEKIDTFDSILNISNHPLVSGFFSRYLFIFICMFTIFLMLEIVYLKSVETVIPDADIDYSYQLVMYFAFLTHDSEIIFFCVLLAMVMRRVKVMKGHVGKLYSHRRRAAAQLEGLSRHANLDVTQLHDAYDLLHTSSEKLNSAMSFPMIVLFTGSGVSSIMLLKNVFRVAQLSDEVNSFFVKVLFLYTVGHCLKFTLLLLMPCHFSTITTTQVSTIRTMLHDAINTKALVKHERRKLKAFFQLTRDSEFAYELWGVIRMDMSLPLSYCSLCVTYLIIVVQFSKFID